MKRFTKHIFRIVSVLFLWAACLHAQMLILSPEENAVTELHRIAVTVMGKPSAEARLYLNDDLASRGEIRVDGKYDFLNVPAPDGPVSLRVESVGAGGRLYIAERNIHVLGPPRKVLPYEDEIRLQADGRSKKTVRFEIQDSWGYRLEHLKIATVEITHGKVAAADIDSISSGVQLPVNAGVLEVPLQAPEEAARAILEVTVAGEVFQFPARFITPQEPFILVGSLSGGASNYQPFPENANEPDAEDWRQHTGSAFDQTFMYGGRFAFYAKGTLLKKYRLTASYDSRRNYRDQFYQDIDPAEQYPVYGDASSLEYDAQSQSGLFAKLERNGSSLMFGDFSTGLTNAEFTAYNRTFTGLWGELNYKSHSLSGFATLTDREMQLDEIRGQGVSGYYYLSEGNVTEYSDKVVIQTRDKYHSEVILRSVEKTRYQDYTINYGDGSVMFKEPVPAVDAEGNPVTIVIAYEHKTGKKQSGIGGVRYDGTILKKLRLGATAIYEERQSSAYMLYGADATLPVFKWLSLKGEYAASLTPDYLGEHNKGEAYKAEIQFAPSDFLNIRGYYRNVDSSFVNVSQSGRANETGSEKYGFTGSLGNAKTGQLTSELYRQYNKIGTVNENAAEVFQIAYRRKLFSRGKVKLAYEDATRIREANSASPSRLHSQLIQGDLTYDITEKLSGSLEREQNLDTTDQSKPTYSAVGVKYNISEKLGVFAKFRRIEGKNAGNQFVLGLDSKVAENTQLTGKYEIGGALGESRNRASIGLKNHWNVTKDLTLNFAYENTATSDHFETPTTEHQALSVAFEYLPEIPWKSSGKWEYHSNKTSQKYNYMFGTDFKIAHGLSVIAKSVYSKVSYRSEENDIVVKSDNQLGLAFRPERSDHYNALVKAAYLLDENTHVRPQTNTVRFIVSSHHYWQPFKRLEIGFRYARRVVIDEEIGLFQDKVTTDFFALRLEYDISLKWYAATDFRYIALQPLDETKVGASAELGYLLARNLQLGIGYAFLDYDDPDFSGPNYLYKNCFVTLHMKFSENIFNWK